MNNVQKSYRSVIIIITIGILLVSVLTIYSFFNFRDNLVTTEQDQLLTIAKSAAKSIEGFIDEKVKDSTIIVKTIVDDYHDDVDQEEIYNFISYTLNNYFKIQDGKVYQVQYFNEESELIYSTLPYGEDVKNTYEGDHLILPDFSSEPLIGEIYELSPKNLALNITTPIFVNGSHKGYVRLIIKTKTIYELYVKEIRVGSKGYASIKDSDGILIMHPKTEDIGVNVMLARKTEFPDYDWSELERIVDIQKQKQSGTGIYHSIWYQDEQRRRIKKFSAFTPVEVGDDFWIVTVSMDFKEFSDIASNYLFINIIMIGLVPLVLILLLIYVLNLKKNIDYLEKEQMYIEQVNELNVELAKDIEERKELEVALYASKERFKQLFNAGTDLTFVLAKNDEKYEIIRVNDMACTQLGLDRNQLIGKDFLSLETTVNQTDLEQFIAYLSVDELNTIEIEMKLSNNIVTPFEVSGQVFALEGRQTIMLIARDILKKKTQEEQLNKDRALLIYKFRLVAMGEMIANITHQWRQPLGSLSLMLSNLNDAFDHQDMDDAYFKKTMADTKMIIQKMSNIIDEFRYFFNPRQEKAFFNLNDQIVNSLDMVKDRINIEEVQVDIQNNTRKKVFGYPNQMSQVILNIINNSLDAMQNKHRQINIQIEDFKDDIRVTIANNGEPIPDEVVDKVFDPYFTTKSNEDGTGIGLYMTKMIIETNFNGTIRMYNTRNFVETEIILPVEEIQ